jgi:hypothetical protein
MLAFRLINKSIVLCLRVLLLSIYIVMKVYTYWSEAESKGLFDILYVKALATYIESGVNWGQKASAAISFIKATETLR